MSTAKYEIGKMYSVDPNDIEIDEKDRGRYQAVEQSKVLSLALNICKNGQLQPVGCRVGKSGKLKLMYGFTRHAAIVSAIANKIEKAPTTIDVLVKDSNDKSSIALNVSENEFRTQTSLIDKAHNIKRMQDAGYSQKEIGEEFGQSTSWVSETLKLLKLPETVQKAVAEERLGSSVAVELVKSGKTKKQMDDAVAAVTSDDGEINSTKLLKELKNATREAASDGGSTRGAGKKQLSIKELKSFWEETANSLDVPLCISNFSIELLKFVDGKIGEKTFRKKLDELIENLSAKAQKDFPPQAPDEVTE